MNGAESLVRILVASGMRSIGPISGAAPTGVSPVEHRRREGGGAGQRRLRQIGGRLRS